MMFAILLVALVTAAVIIVPLRPGQPAVHDQADWEILRFELERARRYDQGFALVRLSERGGGNDERTRTSTQRGTSCSLPVEIRATDRTWSLDGERYVLLVGGAPESTAIWLRQLHRDHVAERFDVTVVHFPDDGLTAQALLDGLAGRARGSSGARSDDLGDRRAAS